MFCFSKCIVDDNVLEINMLFKYGGAWFKKRCFFKGFKSFHFLTFFALKHLFLGKGEKWNTIIETNCLCFY